MTTLFEKAYLSVQPVYPALYRKVREALQQEVQRLQNGHPLTVLDVGGRKSHYTIGLDASVTISDLPRASAVQINQGLGITPMIQDATYRRRSNIAAIELDNMVQTHFTPGSFDLIAAIEVLEHVPEDEVFIRNVARLLRPNGAFFMTTPNGLCVPNTNADHIRHYTPKTLSHVLSKYFSTVQVWSEVRTSTWHRWGLKPWSVKQPIITIKSMIGNAINYYEAPHGNTQHLFARCEL